MNVMASGTLQDAVNFNILRSILFNSFSREYCLWNQSGCENCNNDPLGGWCKATNPICEMIERDDDGNSLGYFYCEKPSMYNLMPKGCWKALF